MFWKTSAADLRRSLDEVNQQIANNPLSAESVVKASKLIDAFKAEGRDSEISEALAQQGLPTSEEIGQLIVQHSFALARLNKKRLNLEKKLALAQK